jgi:lipid A 3-O-deacylase
MKYPPAYSIALLLMLLVWQPAGGLCDDEEREKHWIYSLYFENDTFYQTDHLYTNGVRLSAASFLTDSWESLGLLPAWSLPVVNSLPFVNSSGSYKNITLSMGQMMYTPIDTEASDPSDRDQPYAGLAYTSIGFCARDLKKYTSLELIVGIVGPHSYAEATQTAVHQCLGQDVPAGWDNQIDDELFLNLGLERRRRWRPLYSTTGWGMEWIPSVGTSIGNAVTNVHSGLQLRCGWNLPQDFGENIIRMGLSNTPSEYGSRFHQRRSFAIYTFVGIDGQFVLWDVSLDGNTFDRNALINKEPFRYLVNGGIGATYKNFSLSLALVRSSQAFEFQEDPHEYGTILISCVY